MYSTGKIINEPICALRNETDKALATFDLTEIYTSKQIVKNHKKI